MNDISKFEKESNGDVSEFVDYEPSFDTTGALEVFEPWDDQKIFRDEKVTIDQRPILALDCEYVELEDKSGLKVLSYQWTVLHNGKEHSGIYYPENGKRLKFRAFLKMVIGSAIDDGVLNGLEKYFLFTSHFSRADLSLFDDFFVDLYKDLDVLRKTFVSYQDSSYEISDADINTVLAKQQKLHYWDKNKRKKEVHLQFVDTITLAPSGKSLDELGKAVGFPKVEIPEHLTKARMDLVLKHHPKLFEEYAKRDTQIGARYLDRLRTFVREVLFVDANGAPGNVYRMPTTLGSMGLSLFKRSVGNRFGEFMGMTFQKQKEWNSKAGRYITKSGWAYDEVSKLYSQFPVEAYHGGRNEAFVCGLSPKGRYEDWDFSSCYTTAMQGLRPLDFSKIEHTNDLEKFQGDLFGLARVKFSFPKTVKMPSLAVRNGESLLHTGSGETTATLLEVWGAKNRGAEIEIISGMIIPWASEERIFKDSMQKVRELRKRFPKGSLYERLAKELGNSLYGKLAQGLHKRDIFELFSGKSKRQTPSTITNAYYAAYVTGLVRALAGEVLNGLQKDAQVLNFITDGFLFRGSEDDIDLSGPIAQLYKELFGYIDPEGGSIMECKHESTQVIVGKTRMHVAVEGSYTGAPICAKGNVKVPSGEDAVQYMNRLYKDRVPGQKIESSHFTPVRKMMKQKQDMVMEHKEQRLSLDFDCKRRLINPTMNSFPDGTEHIFMETEPFETVKDQILYKGIFDSFRVDHCLKTMEDWYLWEDYLELKLITKGLGLGTKGIKTTDDLLIKAMVQSWACSRSGFEISPVRAKDLFDWLVSLGCTMFKKPNTLSGIKRSPWKSDFRGCVPATGKVIDMLVKILKQYPNFVYQDVIRMEDLEKVELALQERASASQLASS